MVQEKIIETTWHPGEKLIISQISGDLDIADIIEWEQTLKDALNEVGDNEQFKIFINMYGFSGRNLDAHKRFRTIIPLLLAQYEWKVGYVNLFPEEANQIAYSSFRGIRCIVAAHAHQDATKMELYEKNYSSEREHFFSDPIEAEKWIRELPAR